MEQNVMKLFIEVFNNIQWRHVKILELCRMMQMKTTKEGFKCLYLLTNIHSWTHSWKKNSICIFETLHFGKAKLFLRPLLTWLLLIQSHWKTCSTTARIFSAGASGRPKDFFQIPDYTCFRTTSMLGIYNDIMT